MTANYIVNETSFRAMGSVQEVYILVGFLSMRRRGKEEKKNFLRLLLLCIGFRKDKERSFKVWVLL